MNLSRKKILSIFLIMLFIPLVSNAVLNNPLGTIEINQVVGRVINFTLGLSGSVALLMFVWGGFQWIISNGSPEKIKKGKDTLIWASIGLAVIFSAYTLVNTVIVGLSKGTVT